MSNFRTVFKNRHVILSVIHVESSDQALRNAEIAIEAGADGIFLINHACSSEELFSIHERVKDQFPGLWVGLNVLDLDPRWPMRHLTVEGMWSDTAYISELKGTQNVAENIRHGLRDLTGWTGLYFGGVAFKGERKVRPENLGLAAQKSMSYMDVVTTSGPGTGTGFSPDISKIKTMKESIGDFPLAIASGITPENISSYLGIADCFLVATGISSDFLNLDPVRVRELIDRVR